jgi:hypothetical protein
MSDLMVERVPASAHGGAERALQSSATRWALLITAIVLVSWIAGAAPIIDGETRRGVPGVRLAYSAAYLVLSPLYDVMDALTLLSVRQTIVVILSLAALYILWRVGRRRPTTSLREITGALIALGGLLAFYAAGILVPRPMAALRATDPDVVLVDVHSHTRFSHDARRGFDAGANRDWHQKAGFDVVYVTDHKSFAGAATGMQRNPARAGDSLVVLSGIEFTVDGNHLNALGVTARDSAWLRAAVRDPEAARGILPANRPEPVLIQTIPENLDHVPPSDAEGRNGVLAIELSDGAPRGIEQAQRDRARILRIADSLGLAVVAGSNNHGWGRTAVAWSLVRIPGWRALSPDSLGKAIEQRIRTARRHAVQVIARRSPNSGRSRLALATTLPAVAWNMWATLSPAQRVSWVVWSWLLAAVANVRAARRRGLPVEA